MTRNLVVTAVVLLAGLAAWVVRQFWWRGGALPAQPRSTEQVTNALRGEVEPNLRSSFKRVGAAWPPKEVTLLAFKEERGLEVWAKNEEGLRCRVVTFPILGASGTAGPKLREGDYQVPEGFYRIELLNPNSRFHLSLRVNYPNGDDIQRAREEGREIAKLGGDIMIHGGASSSGCLAIGDDAVEEVFYLASMMNLDGLELIIAPRDFRKNRDMQPTGDAPGWTGDLYEEIAKRLAEFEAN